MTNREWLEKLDNREMAEALAEKIADDCSMPCKWDETPDCLLPEDDCVYVIMQWLEAEHKEYGND